MEQQNDTPLRGNIFDIRRFCIHDGIGIRTTVFLKGCPLRCVWCQNPEGIEPHSRPVWFDTSCIRCKACSGGASASSGTDGKDMLLWKDNRLCIQTDLSADWETPMNRCPTGALRLDSRSMDTSEVMTVLRKDSVFYRHGGGITLSGGEPLMQHTFVRELLILAKREGFHTAVETSLAVDRTILEDLLPYIDQLFADCKLYDDPAHIRYTGISNKGILENLRLLLSSPLRDRVIVRTPLIPGITAAAENIEAIAGYINSLYSGVQYELLNYNPLAAGKYPHTGFHYPLPADQPPYTVKELDYFKNLAARKGLSHITVS